MNDDAKMVLGVEKLDVCLHPNPAHEFLDAHI
jgi:hypothetical protein